MFNYIIVKKMNDIIYFLSYEVHVHIAYSIDLTLSNHLFRSFQYNLAILANHEIHPNLMKVPEIMIQKPGKPAELTESYRPISLLPILSKLFEKLLLSRISIIVKSHGFPITNLAFEVNIQ